LEEFPAKKAFSRIGFAMLIFLLVPQILAAVLFAIFSAAAPSVVEAGWFVWVASFVPMYLIAFPLMLLILRGVPNGDGNPAEKTKLSVLKLFGLVVVCYGITILFNLFSTFLASLVETLMGSAPANNLAEAVSGGSLLISFIAVVFVAPIMEEIIFRGILYKKLSPYGGKVYIFFSSLFFAIIHQNIYQLFYAFALGLVFGLITWSTGTIRYAIILHIGLNFLGTGVPVILQAISGGNYEAAIGVWGLIALTLAAAGLILGIVWFVRRRKDITFAPPAQALPAKRSYVCSLGMIFYWTAAILLLIGVTFLLPLLG